ncbi:MAG: HdeD family acid-resistance protein [Desulfobulbaceae bacterium]|nr:HdeD family acid-resistance protein [Desulfobulbaceae bacterium]
MYGNYGKFWWSFFIRGVIAVVFGLAALLLPGITIDVLMLLVGAFIVADGVFSIISSAGNRAVESQWWVLLLEGLTGLFIGLFTFIRPDVTLALIIILLAVWAFITGVIEIVAAIRLRKVISNEWFLALSGFLSLVFGSILLGRPDLGAVALVWLIGIYALFFGILLIFLGFKLKKFYRSN